jgi:protocatechuate 3,4-dioxygenase beta subunit
VCLFVLVGIVTTAQEITGSITGRVTDKSGGVVADAMVSVVNIDKNDALVRSVRTDETGDYVASVLPIRTIIPGPISLFPSSVSITA